MGPHPGRSCLKARKEMSEPSLQESVRRFGLVVSQGNCIVPPTELFPCEHRYRPTLPTRLMQTVSNSAGSTGLATCIWYPARSTLWRSSERAKAVSATAGIFAPDSDGRDRTRRIKSYPSSPGIPISLINSSGRVSRINFSASDTEPAVMIEAPVPARIRRIKSRASGSSSTTSTVTPRRSGGSKFEATPPCDRGCCRCPSSSGW